MLEMKMSTSVMAIAVLFLNASHVQGQSPRPARFELGYVIATSAATQEAKFSITKPVFFKLRDTLAVNGKEESGWLFLTSDTGVPILIDLKEGMVADALRRRQLWRELDSAVGEDGLVSLSKLSVDSCRFLLNYFALGDSASLPSNRSSVVMLTCEAYLIDGRTGENLGHSMTKPVTSSEWQRRTGAMEAAPFDYTAQAKQIAKGEISPDTHPKQSINLRACLINHETEQIESLQSATEAVFKFLDPVLKEQKRLEENVMKKIGYDIAGVDETRRYSFSELPREMQRKMRMVTPDGEVNNSSTVQYMLKKHVLLNVMFKNGNTVSYIAVSIKH